MSGEKKLNQSGVFEPLSFFFPMGEDSNHVPHLFLRLPSVAEELRGTSTGTGTGTGTGTSTGTLVLAHTSGWHSKSLMLRVLVLLSRLGVQFEAAWTDIHFIVVEVTLVRAVATAHIAG